MPPVQDPENIDFVEVRISQPTPGQQVYVGFPFKVEGSAESSLSQVSAVTLEVDRHPVTPANETGDWHGWHYDLTPTAAGAHTLSATAVDNARKQGSSPVVSVNAVVDTPGLTCKSPALNGAREIVTSSRVVSLAITAQTAVAKVTKVESQLDGGAWVALSPPGAPGGSWQGQVTLPSNLVLVGGSTHQLMVRATTEQAVVATLPLTVRAIDGTKPTVSFAPALAEFQAAGTTPTVTVQVSDQLAGVISTGIASVSVQLDSGAPQPATEVVAGDPSTWSAKIGPLTHDFHTVTVVATDRQGNTGTASQPFQVALVSWTRLEPIPRDPTLMEGLEARIADPLWLLARQAAFGEFAGLDAASPISVRLRGRSSSVTRMRPAYQLVSGAWEPATGAGELLPQDGGPLETLSEAEAEPTAEAPRALFAAQAGLHYLRLLGAAPGVGDWSVYRQGLLRSYPLPPSVSPGPGVPPQATADDALLQPYIGRVPDGCALYEDLVKAVGSAGAGALPASPALGAAPPASVLSVAKDWLVWYEAASGRSLGTRDTWRPDRMEYAFSIAAPGPDAEVVLTADECDTGELDWFDFDLAASEVQPASGTASLGAVAADRPGGAAADAFTFVALPAPVAFRGMPNRRWWDFDDSSIDFGSISAPVEDVATSLLVEFALRYGNDHFMIPVPLDVGSVCRIDSLVVIDTFGEVLAIDPVSEVDHDAPPFRLFEQTVIAGGADSGKRDPLFVLFPTLGEVVNGPALEEVHFLRDEAAEIVWAIEQTALGPSGVPYDRTSDATARFTPPPPTPNDGSSPPTRQFVLRTDVEQNWFPFLLPDSVSGTTLTLAVVPSLDGKFTPLPWGRILAPFAANGGSGTPLGMPQEEVTRTGMQVTRTWRYARWIDGRQLAWVGRRTRPGRGPGASGLSFDLAV